MTLQNILKQYSNEYNEFKKTNELDSNSDFYLSLFDYFMNSDDFNFYNEVKNCTDNEYITNQLQGVNND